MPAGSKNNALSVIQEERSHIDSLASDGNIHTDINGSFKNSKPSSIENKML